MTLPNFLIIGVPRSGTTSLYRYLSKHPDIYVSPVKETNFFIADRWSDAAVESLDDYKALFSEGQTHSRRGEASPEYFYHSEHLSDQIEKLIPEVRLILLLRNPVDRAYSEYLHLRRGGWDPASTFKKAFNLEPQRSASQHKYAQRGFYAEALERWMNRFGDQMLIHLFDDLKSDPQSVVQKTPTFLEVDPDVHIGTEKRHNKASYVQDHWLHPLLSWNRIGRAILRRLDKTPVIRREVDPAIADSLKETYADDIQRVELLIHRDLSPWYA